MTTDPATNSRRGHLRTLENESIHILREVAAQFERPMLLFSGGKDSIVVSWLARKAFHPAPPPFSLLHVDTGHNFPETLTFRDTYAAQLGYHVHVALVQDSIDAGRVVEEAPVEALFGNPKHPYTQGLIRSIPRIDLDAQQKHRLEAIPGTVPKLIEPAPGCRFADRCRYAQPDCRRDTPPLRELSPGHKVACFLAEAG